MDARRDVLRGNDLALALLVGDDVGPDDLRPESGLVEPALEDRRVGRRLDDRDRVDTRPNLIL